MKKLLIALTAIALLGLMAFAGDPNPWAGDGDTVAFGVLVPNITELWSNIGTGQARNGAPAVVLEITNAGGVIPATGKASDVLNHISNVPVQIYVTLQGDIPVYTRFHVIIEPTNAYDCMPWGMGTTPCAATTIITWDRRDPAYVGNALNVEIAAFTGIVTTGIIPHNVDYAVDAIHGMPAKGTTNTTVLWTIASTI